MLTMCISDPLESFWNYFPGFLKFSHFYRICSPISICEGGINVMSINVLCTASEVPASNLRNRRREEVTFCMNIFACNHTNSTLTDLP